MPSRITKERVRQLYKGAPTKAEKIKPICKNGYNFNTTKFQIIRDNLKRIKQDPSYAKKLMGG